MHGGATRGGETERTDCLLLRKKPRGNAATPSLLLRGGGHSQRRSSYWLPWLLFTRREYCPEVGQLFSSRNRSLLNFIINKYINIYLYTHTHTYIYTHTHTRIEYQTYIQWIEYHIYINWIEPTLFRHWLFFLFLSYVIRCFLLPSFLSFHLSACPSLSTYRNKTKTPSTPPKVLPLLWSPSRSADSKSADRISTAPVCSDWIITMSPDLCGPWYLTICTREFWSQDICKGRFLLASFQLKAAGPALLLLPPLSRLTSLLTPVGQRSFSLLQPQVVINSTHFYFHATNMFPSLELLSCFLQLFATFPLQTLHKNLAHKHPQGLLLTFPSAVFLGHACTAPPHGSSQDSSCFWAFTQPHVLLLQFPSRGSFQIAVHQSTKVL